MGQGVVGKIAKDKATEGSNAQIVSSLKKIKWF